jgi:hypothetical protein
MPLKVKPHEPIRQFREQPLTTVYRRWMCAADGCDGEMKPSGQAFASYPPQYPHHCEKCLRIETASTMYPRIAYLPIEALETDPVSNGT